MGVSDDGRSRPRERTGSASRRQPPLGRRGHGIGRCPWSAAIETVLEYPPTDGAEFWTAWGDPRLSALSAENGAEAWSDPLTPVPFADEIIYYGAPPYLYEEPRIGFIPFQGNLFGIPLVTISEEKSDLGLSLVLSPEDDILDLNLRVRPSGEMAFSRERHRIAAATPVRFRMDLVAHESGWRGGLRWLAAHHAGFFDPNLPLAHEVAGTGAYSSLEKEFDLEKMRRMAFGVNWKASFDFPYMGMFIPPVGSETNLLDPVRRRDDHPPAPCGITGGMRRPGVPRPELLQRHRIRAGITDPPPPGEVRERRGSLEERRRFPLWTAGRGDPPRAGGRTPGQTPSLPAVKKGRPVFHLGDGIIMDPASRSTRSSSSTSREKHIRLIPEAAGICIDRLDWLRMYNEDRDDGLSWVGGRPARSLLVSWRTSSKNSAADAQRGESHLRQQPRQEDRPLAADGRVFRRVHLRRGAAQPDGLDGSAAAGPGVDRRGEEPPARPGRLLPALPTSWRFPDGPLPRERPFAPAGRVGGPAIPRLRSPCSDLSKEEMGARAALRRGLWCDGQGQPFRGAGGWLVPVTSPKEEDQRHPPQRAGLRGARSGSLLSGTEETERVTLEDAAGR